MKIGSGDFKTEGKTYIMGILNVTPDSFYDGGSLKRERDLYSRIETMIKDGADIIDVGGESTRPGYTAVSADEELSRVIPAIKAIRRVSDIPVSVDTMKAEVAKESVREGADLINDVWGGSDKDMRELIAKEGVACCLMHNRKEIYRECSKEDYIDKLNKELKAIADNALLGGINADRIILDPGIGFSKSHRQNLLIMGNLERLKEAGYPMLLGASRKSFIGKALLLEKEDRLEGTLTASIMGAMAGYMFVRVHDIRENRRAIDMFEAIKKESEI
ncbi:MAG: dihydropteroate synthase [Lachnospiraceae bacterium]|nr:dihydropteroate synthase [Lachnospiraceae bacterium]